MSGNLPPGCLPGEADDGVLRLIFEIFEDLVLQVVDERELFNPPLTPAEYKAKLAALLRRMADKAERG